MIDARSNRPLGTVDRGYFPLRRIVRILGAILILSVPIFLGGGAAGAAKSPHFSGALVVDWNKELIKIVETPGAQPATIHSTRSFAILHAAMYDAVVSITHRGSPYLFSLNVPAKARPDAATAQAGHDTLLALYPSMQGALDQELAGELAAIPNGVAKQEGIAVGHLAAEVMLAERADDGASLAPPVLPAGITPGAYRPTPPANAPAAFTQ